MASVHKNLYMAITHLLKKPGDASALAEVTEALHESELYLGSTKTFEYSGKIEMNGGNIIKCADIRSDLDDIMRALNKGDRKVERTGYICIILDELPEKPAEAAATVPATTDVLPEALVG